MWFLIGAVILLIFTAGFQAIQILGLREDLDAARDLQDRLTSEVQNLVAAAAGHGRHAEKRSPARSDITASPENTPIPPRSTS